MLECKGAGNRYRSKSVCVDVFPCFLSHSSVSELFSGGKRENGERGAKANTQ